MVRDGCDCGCSSCYDCSTEANRGLCMLFSLDGEQASAMAGDGNHLGLDFDSGFLSLDPWCIRVSCLPRSAGGLLGFNDKDQ